MRESARARQAWVDYLALGAGRSLEKLLAQYRAQSESGASTPTLRFATLAAWSSAFGWQARLQAIADEQAAEIAAQQAAYRREIMERGFALDFERVKGLKSLAERLVTELLFGNRLWLKEPKQVGDEIVEIERFNSAEMTQLRGLLDDIAKEKGERRTVVDLNVIRREAQRLADELGLDAAEVIAEAERIAAGRG